MSKYLINFITRAYVHLTMGTTHPTDQMTFGESDVENVRDVGIKTPTCQATVGTTKAGQTKTCSRGSVVRVKSPYENRWNYYCKQHARKTWLHMAGVEG